MIKTYNLLFLLIISGKIPKMLKTNLLLESKLKTTIDKFNRKIEEEKKRHANEI